MVQVPELWQHLSKTLPEHMVPSAFVLLDALPLTPNGKIDRGAWPTPDRARPKTASAAAPPGNDFERVIASVLQALLAIDVVGLDDNFFDLGANSLSMVQASVRLRSSWGWACRW